MDEAGNERNDRTRFCWMDGQLRKKSTTKTGNLLGEASCLAWTSQASWPIRCTKSKGDVDESCS